MSELDTKVTVEMPDGREYAFVSPGKIPIDGSHINVCIIDKSTMETEFDGVVRVKSVMYDDNMRLP